jgi:hypothetical protein
MTELWRYSGSKPRQRSKALLDAAGVPLIFRVPCRSAEERSWSPGKGELFEARDSRVVRRPVASEHRRGPSGLCPIGADAGVPFSLVTFLLGKQEKVTRSPKASESFALKNTAPRSPKASESSAPRMTRSQKASESSAPKDARAEGE